MNARTRLLVLASALWALAAVGETTLRAGDCDDRGYGSNRSEAIGRDVAVPELVVATAPDGSSQMPADLMSAFQLARHAIVREGRAGGGSEAYLASNYSQELRARFEAGAMVVTPRKEEMGGWSLRLRTTGWGRAGAMRALGAAERVATGPRLEYRHSGFTEWYVNEPGKGIEQGFTVTARPAGEGPLRVELATGGLRAEIVDERTASLRTPAGEAVLRYAGLVALDATGRALPARLVAVGGALALEVEDRDAVYPVTIDPLLASLQAKLLHRTSEGVEQESWGGFSVAVDLDTALVGAPGDDTPRANDAGSVYVFTRSGTSWTQQAVLVAGDGAAGDTFGQSVALSGDTALVGAYADDTSAGSDAGSAYVFVRSGTTWTQQQQLLAGDGTPGELFGESVALSGNTALVGARADDTGGTDAGSAYVFTRAGTTWTQQQELFADDAATGDWFGAAVALDGDTAVVGARLGDVLDLVDAGAAYLFIRSGTTWTIQQKLVAIDRAAGDQLGTSVSISGGTALVGAWHAATAGGSGAGAAYVYTRTGPTWTQQKLLADDGASGDSFGISVSVSGDTALVGARLDDSAGDADVGSAYVFTRSGTSWSQQQKLLAGDGAAGDELGISVSLSGDTAVVGAWHDDTASGIEAGSALVFIRTGSAWSQQQKLLPSDGAEFDQLGFALSLSGDTALVGAHGEDSPAGTIGAAYVFTRSGSAWTLQQRLVAADGAANDDFGVSVSLSGNTALVGAILDDTPAGTDAGSAYVFVRTGATWSQQQKLLASNGSANDWFGRSVSVAGDTALVGAFVDDTGGGSDAGSAYVFVRTGTTWTQQQQLVADDGAAGDQFGRSVAISGDTALVGAWLDDTSGGEVAGSAYVFIRAGTTWTEQQKLLAPDGALADEFGVSVSIFEDTALVGAWHDDTDVGGNVGAAHVFVRTGTTWTHQQKLLADDGAAGDQFGYSVSVDGQRALVGAPLDDTFVGGADAGSAYVFTRTGTTWTQQTQLLAFDGAAGDLFGASVSLSGDTALVGAPSNDTVGGEEAGSAYVFVPAQPACFYTLTPCRVFDSRQPSDGPALTSGQVRVIPVHGRCGVPSSATSISFNVTVVGSTGGGHLTVYPANLGVPPTSTINFKVGQTRANNGVVSLATNGAGSLAIRPAVAGGGTVHAIVDVNGYFE